MDQTNPDTTLSEEDVRNCVRVLRAIEADRSHLTRLTREQRRELLTLAGLVAKPERHDLVKMAKAFRRAEREAAKERDRKVVEQTGLRVQRRAATYAPLWLEPPKPEDLGERPQLHQERSCYVCKKPFVKMHRYYDSMCDECGDFNYAKREQTADLSGHYALVTGARVKIGFQAALKLLRAGAHVIVTTRFPVDAADRYSQEPDFAAFRDRLQIHGLDLRHTPSVELFTRFLVERLPRLDYILPDGAAAGGLLSAPSCEGSGVTRPAAAGPARSARESRRTAAEFGGGAACGLHGSGTRACGGDRTGRDNCMGGHNGTGA
jgi:hypothetical protein